MKTLGLLCLGVLAVATAGLALARLGPRERVVAAYETSLTGRSAGQRHNARLSCARLDGFVLRPGETFSFNGRVGSFSRDDGYRKAPVSYNGQLIVAWGGGVCQTSTTLYNAALVGGLRIVERHRHQFAPSYVPPGRDAAVAFSSVDLKLQNPHAFPVRIQARVLGDRVLVQLVASQDLAERPIVVSDARPLRQPETYVVGEVRPEARERLRNTGKSGYSVSVYRLTGGHRELISADLYPKMDRVVEYGN